MRKKALIVGGLSSFKGPWVNLEEGLWLVEPPLCGVVEILVSFGDNRVDLLRQLDRNIAVEGPAKVRAIVIDCESEDGIHLDIKNIKKVVAMHPTVTAYKTRGFA